MWQREEKDEMEQKEASSIVAQADACQSSLNCCTQISITFTCCWLRVARRLSQAASTHTHTHVHTLCDLVCLETFEIAFALRRNALSMRRLPFLKFIIIARQ